MFIKSFLQDIKSCVFGISIIWTLPLDQAAAQRAAVLQQRVLMDNLFYQSCVGLGTWWVLRTPTAMLHCATHWVYITTFRVWSLLPCSLFCMSIFGKHYVLFWELLRFFYNNRSVKMNSVILLRSAVLENTIRQMENTPMTSQEVYSHWWLLFLQNLLWVFLSTAFYSLPYFCFSKRKMITNYLERIVKIHST